MLSPRRTKFLKHQRGRIKGLAHKGNTISFGDFALQATEPSWISSQQIEAARRAMNRYIRRGGKIWIRIFPDKPISMRPDETRMGSGKGSPEYWVAVVKPGRIIFEIAEVSEEVAREAMRLASHKLPIKTQFIICKRLSKDDLVTSQAGRDESEIQLRKEENSGSKIDAFLRSAFDLLDKGFQPEGIGMSRNKRRIPLFPMMIEVKNSSWKANNLPQYRETERLGRFIGCWGSKNTMKALEKDSSVISIGASFQAGGWSNSSSRVESSCLSSCNFLELIKANDAHKSERGNKAIVAIIDTGIDLLHDAFLGSDGKTRILGIFDLTNDTKYTKDQIDEFLKNHSVPEELGRDLGARGVLNDGTKKGGHGTHVASIAAGMAGTKFKGGVAPEAWIVAVKIPEIPIQGYPNIFLKALNYIKETATHFNLPFVINVSLGLHIGAHDGSNDIERLFEEFLDGGKQPGRAIVKAAGNEKETKRHAMLQIPVAQSRSFIWGGLQKRSQDIVELWFSPAANMEFYLQAPSQKDISNLVNKKEGKRVDNNNFLTGNSYSIEYTFVHRINRLSQLLVNINKGSIDTVELGNWILHVTNAGSSDQVIHSWIQSSEYQDGTCCFQREINQNVTLTIPGTGKNVITVAALKENLNPYINIKPAPWDLSSLGPTQDKREKPDVAAFGDMIMAACSDSNNDICLMSGTSMSAPQVTGAIALFLSAREKKRGSQPRLLQITAAQINTAVVLSAQSNGSYSWNEATGYGLIDVKALIELLDLFD
jgi:ribosomal protein L16